MNKINSNINTDQGTKKPNNTFISWLFLIILALVWGSSFILIKKGLTAFSPAQVASIRVFVGFLTVLPMALFSLKHVPLAKWKFLLISGVLGVFLPAFLFAFAQTKVSSLLAGILNSLTPLFALVSGIIFFNQRGSLAKYLGVFIGFIGTTLLIMMNKSGGQLTVNIYALLIICASVMYGLNVNIIKTYLTDLPPLHVSTLSLFVLGPFATGALFNLNIVTTYQQTPGSTQALIYLIILGFVSTGLATILFYRLLQMTSALFASSVTYLIPIVAVSWGILDGESLGWVHVLSMLLIISGVVIVNKA